MNKPIVKYSQNFLEIQAFEAEFLAIEIQSHDDSVNYDIAKEALKKVRKCYNAIEKERKEFKADALEYGRKVDSDAKVYFAPLTTIENHLKKQLDIVEGHTERLRQEQVARDVALAESRLAELKQLGVFTHIDSLMYLAEEVYQSFKASKIAEKEKAEAEAKELEKLRVQNAELLANQKALEAKIEAKVTVQEVVSEPVRSDNGLTERQNRIKAFILNCSSDELEFIQELIAERIEHENHQFDHRN